MRCTASVYGYFRNQRLNAANPLSNTKLPLTQAQYGASLGGPVVRNRTFYFANFEQRLLNQSGLITIAPANVEAINARLRSFGLPGRADCDRPLSESRAQRELLREVDHQFNARICLARATACTGVYSENSRGAGALNAATASAGLDNLDQTIAASNIADAVAADRERDARPVHVQQPEAPPSDPIGPAVSIAGVARSARWPVARRDGSTGFTR